MAVLDLQEAATTTTRACPRRAAKTVGPPSVRALGARREPLHGPAVRGRLRPVAGGHDAVGPTERVGAVVHDALLRARRADARHGAVLRAVPRAGRHEHGVRAELRRHRHAARRVGREVYVLRVPRAPGRETLSRPWRCVVDDAKSSPTRQRIKHGLRLAERGADAGTRRPRWSSSRRPTSCTRRRPRKEVYSRGVRRPANSRPRNFHRGKIR